MSRFASWIIIKIAVDPFTRRAHIAHAPKGSGSVDFVLNQILVKLRRNMADAKQEMKQAEPSKEIALNSASDPKNVQDLTQYVQTLLQQMQDKFQTMSDQIISRIDDMGNRIDELEKNIADLMTQAGIDEVEK